MCNPVPIFTHLMNLPASYFESRYLGDVMSRFESQDTILKGLTTQLVEAVLDGLMAAITLGMMSYLAPGLGIIVLIGALLCRYPLDHLSSPQGSNDRSDCLGSTTRHAFS